MVTKGFLHLAAGLVIAQLAAADPSHGCTDGFPKPVEWFAKAQDMRIFRVNDRNVRVVTPKNYKNTTATPMIIAFHDKDQSPEYLEYDAAFSDPDINPDAIVVYPAAINDRWLSDFSPPPKKELPKSKNATADLQFMNFLLKDMESLLCVDSARIYAVGLGTGGGMAHMMACDEELSNKFAAVAAVGGAFGVSKDPKSPWNKCKPGRKPIPVAEIHGLDDRIVGYYLKEGENGRVRQIPQHWIEEWADRNGCGFAESDPFQEDESTFVTKLDVGTMSESVTHSGGAIRIARRCLTKRKSKKDEENPRTLPPTLAETDVLHIKVKGYGHGWPRQQLRREETVILNDVEITPSGDVFFDTSKILLEWFAAHALPAKLAERFPVFEMGGSVDDKDRSKNVQAKLKAQELLNKKLRESQRKNKPKAEEDEDEEENEEDSQAEKNEKTTKDKIKDEL